MGFISTFFIIRWTWWNNFSINPLLCWTAFSRISCLIHLKYWLVLGHVTYVKNSIRFWNTALALISFIVLSRCCMQLVKPGILLSVFFITLVFTFPCLSLTIRHISYHNHAWEDMFALYWLLISEYNHPIFKRVCYYIPIEGSLLIPYMHLRFL